MSPQEIASAINIPYQDEFRRLVAAGIPVEDLQAGPDAVTLEDAFQAAKIRTPASGLAAAWAMAKLLSDTRKPNSGRGLMAALASPHLPSAVRTHLAADRDVQRALDTRHFIVTTVPAYFRYRVDGPVREPTGVEVEFAVEGHSERLASYIWFAFRYDLRWEPSSGWRIVAYSDGLSASVDATLEPAERDRLLAGPGWKPLSR
jgi:hypothetical protein